MECVWCRRKFVLTAEVWGRQGKRKQKCIHRVCTEVFTMGKGMVNIFYTIASLQVFHNHVLSADQTQKNNINQRMIGNQTKRSGTLSKLTNRWQEHRTIITRQQFLHLQTTPELYTTLTEVFVDKPLVKNRWHLILAKIFLPRVEQKYKCSVETRQYCLSVDTSGVWGTGIELLAAAAVLQAPVYTCTLMGTTEFYWWSRFHPPILYVTMLLASKKLVHMPKPCDWHIKLLT